MKRQNQMRQMLPQDIAAEQSVLGAMLLDRGAIEKAMARLKPEDFYRPDDQIIFSAIVDLYKQDLQPDAVSLAKLLRERDQLDKIGGIKELTVLENLIPTSAMVEHHAGIVAEMALRRRTIKACQEIARSWHVRVDVQSACNQESELPRLFCWQITEGGQTHPYSAITAEEQKLGSVLAELEKAVLSGSEDISQLIIQTQSALDDRNTACRDSKRR